MTETEHRTAWRAALADLAVKARANLPESNGRIDSAVKLVLAGDVTLLPDNKAEVGSLSDAAKVYHVAQGECDCKDFKQAAQNLCKHRLAVAFVRRVNARKTLRLPRCLRRGE